MTHPDDLSLGAGGAQPPGGRGRASGRPVAVGALSLGRRRVSGPAQVARRRPDQSRNEPRDSDAAPSNRSAEASRAPRGHVNDDPLARAGVVSDNPCPSRPRRLQGSRRDTPRTTSSGSSCPLRSRSPCGARSRSLDPALRRSLGFLPFRLAAFLRASLAPTLRCSLEVRRALVSELETGCASAQREVNGPFAKSRCSPHLSAGRPQITLSPSPVFPHAGGGSPGYRGVT